MKRSLALVLALVMVLGMMAIPASADFTDAKDVKYTEAVDVVAACGIINGFENGSFDPTGTLTREQAAKIVAYMRLGADNADALKATSAPFEDVAANRWSAGYIAYCVNEGIINGRSDKIFDPTGTVTGFEFAKLMLGALGYDSSIEQYTGASWAINVGKTALDIELFDGNDGADYNKPCTREEAALYVFNTLQADLVEYDKKGSTIDLGNGITINTGASDAKAVTTNNKNGANIADEKDGNNDVKEYTYQFAEKYFTDLEKNTSDSDAFMRPANQWDYDGEDVGTYAQTPDLTYTAKVKGEDIYKALGKPSTDKTNYHFYVDGVEKSPKTANADSQLPGDAGFTGINADCSKKVGGNGITIEVYKLDNADDGYKTTYAVCLINTYAGTIQSWKAAKGSADEYVTITPADGSTVPTNFGNGKYETEIFSDSDADDETVVYYTFSQKSGEQKIQSAFAAESVKGVVTATKAEDGFTMGGTSYKYNATYTDQVAYDADQEDEVEVYLDANGYVVYTDSVDSDDQFALVLDISHEGNWGGSSKSYYAKVVFPGTSEIKVVTLKNEAAYNKLDGVDGDTFAVASYTVSKDKYVFDNVDLLGTGTVDITTKKAAMTIDGTKITGNSKTEFLFVKSDKDDLDDYKFTAYTGIKNVPDSENKSGTASAFIKNSDGDVALVVVVDAKTSSTGSVDDLMYVYGNTVSKLQKDADHEDGYYTMKAYNVTSDEAVVLKLDPTFVDGLSNKKANFFITAYYTSDDLVDAWDVVDAYVDADTTDEFASITAKTLIKYADGNVKMYTLNADGKTEENVKEFGVADSANVFYVDTTDKTVDQGNITGLKKTTENVDYTVLVNEDDLVVAVYVFED